MRMCILLALAELKHVTSTIGKEALAPAIELTILVAPVMCPCRCTPWSRVRRFLFHVSNTGTCYERQLKPKNSGACPRVRDVFLTPIVDYVCLVDLLSSSRFESPCNQWRLHGAMRVRRLIVMGVVVYIYDAMRELCSMC